MVRGNAELTLQLKWRLYHDCCEAGNQMPVNVTVKEPHAGIIRYKPDQEVPLRSHHEGVTAHRDLRESIDGL